MNSKAGGGGLAGRKVVIDFYDSKLNPDETNNAQIKACQNDVAMVGTSAVFLTSVDNMRNCKDSTGAVTGLPDIPFVSTALVQQCSDQSFPIAPPQVAAATQRPSIRRRSRRTWRAATTTSRSTARESPRRLRLRERLQVGARRVVRQPRRVCVTSGIKSDEDFDLPGAAPQSAYTPVVQEMKSSGSNYGQADHRTRDGVMRKEAALQGLTGVKVWDCGVRCYDKLFIDAGGADVEGQYVDTLFLPFYSKADQKANPMLANVVKYIGADNVAGFSAYAWAAGIAFRDAVNAAGEGGRRQQRHAQDDLRAAEQDQQVRRRRHDRPDRPRRVAGISTAA